jgi:hypothetical protein
MSKPEADGANIYFRVQFYPSLFGFLLHPPHTSHSFHALSTPRGPRAHYRRQILRARAWGELPWGVRHRRHLQGQAHGAFIASCQTTHPASRPTEQLDV